ncbi:MAG: YbaK/EbsC family protein [Selenomonadaceae bacterium]|nr:YbaK/EbsC family protein [Selenomonadaceae bacterium]
MAIDKVKNFLESINELDRLMIFEESTATVDQAAAAVGCKPGNIAKTISLLVDNKPILILLAGDVKIDNHKFKDTFKTRAKMIPIDQVEELIGHAVGGVCPFAVNDGVPIYFDESLKRFETIYPAGGNEHSAVRLKLDELEKFINSVGWVDVSKFK